MWLLSVWVCIRPIMQASPELVRFSMWPPFCPRIPLESSLLFLGRQSLFPPPLLWSAFCLYTLPFLKTSYKQNHMKCSLPCLTFSTLHAFEVHSHCCMYQFTPFLLLSNKLSIVWIYQILFIYTRGVQLTACRPHAAQGGYECSPTQNHKFT